MNDETRDADCNDDWHEPVDEREIAAAEAADARQIRELDAIDADLDGIPMMPSLRSLLADAARDVPAGFAWMIDRQEPTGFFAEQSTVYVTLPSGESAHVNAEGPRRAGMNGHGPRVNWSAMGAVHVDDAMVYALAIIEACRVARTLAGPTEETTQ